MSGGLRPIDQYSSRRSEYEYMVCSSQIPVGCSCACVSTNHEGSYRFTWLCFHAIVLRLLLRCLVLLLAGVRPHVALDFVHGLLACQRR